MMSVLLCIIGLHFCLSCYWINYLLYDWLMKVPWTGEGLRYDVEVTSVVHGAF